MSDSFINYSAKSRYYLCSDKEGLIMEDTSVMNVPSYETVVMKTEERRPELLAQRVYGDARYWWVIMRANAIFDTYSLMCGRIVRVPEIGAGINSVIGRMV